MSCAMAAPASSDTDAAAITFILRSMSPPRGELRRGFRVFLKTGETIPQFTSRSPSGILGSQPVNRRVPTRRHHGDVRASPAAVAPEFFVDGLLHRLAHLVRQLLARL